MNETADAASNIPAIIFLTVWWTLLLVVDRFSKPPEPGVAKRVRGNAADSGSQSATSSYPALQALESGFETEAFLDGAKQAYGATLTAFAESDLDTLRTLLSPDVLQAFAVSVAERAARGELLELSVMEFDSVEIVDVNVLPDAVEVSVLIRAQVVSSTRNAHQDIFQRDPAVISLTADLWTFSRALTVEHESWSIVATDEPQA